MPEASRDFTAIESPCIGVCTLDDQGVCMGCFRTTQEIAAWVSYTPWQRRQIIAELPARAQALFDD